MGKRRIISATAVALLLLSSCGSDGPSALSEDDFLSSLSDVCTTAQDAFDAIPAPQGLPDVESAAKTSIKILKKAKTALTAILPPATYSRDFKKFQNLVDDEIDTFTDLRDAATDGDQAAAEKASTKLDGYLKDQANIASDLDSDDCSGASKNTPTTDVPPVATTLPVVTVAETTPVATLPPTIAPVITTAPPVITTIPVATIPEPVQTTAPANGTSISTDSVTANFVAPAGYTMNDTAPDIVTNIVDGLSADGTLGGAIDVIGIADLVDSSNTIVARLFIAFTPDSGTMPAAWSDYFCSGQGTAASTPGGFNGTQCSLDDGNGGTQNFFALQGGTAGFAILTVDASLDLPGLVDAFFTANPGT